MKPYIFPQEAIDSLKKMFPEDSVLSEALDNNDFSAYYIVEKYSSKLYSAYREIGDYYYRENKIHITSDVADKIREIFPNNKKLENIFRNNDVEGIFDINRELSYLFLSIAETGPPGDIYGIPGECKSRGATSAL